MEKSIDNLIYKILCSKKVLWLISFSCVISSISLVGFYILTALKYYGIEFINIKVISDIGADLLGLSILGSLAIGRIVWKQKSCLWSKRSYYIINILLFNQILDYYILKPLGIPISIEVLLTEITFLIYLSILMVSDLIINKFKL